MTDTTITFSRAELATLAVSSSFFYGTFEELDTSEKEYVVAARSAKAKIDAARRVCLTTGTRYPMGPSDPRRHAKR